VFPYWRLLPPSPSLSPTVVRSPPSFAKNFPTFPLLDEPIVLSSLVLIDLIHSPNVSSFPGKGFPLSQEADFSLPGYIFSLLYERVSYFPFPKNLSILFFLALDFGTVPLPLRHAIRRPTRVSFFLRFVPSFPTFLFSSLP